MMPSTQRTRLVYCLFALAITLLPSAQALSWRLFAGREECLGEYLHDRQWAYLVKHTKDPAHSKMYLDLGFVVTSKYGTEESKAAVDVTVYDPNNQVVHQEAAVGESEVGIHAVGNRGPWRVCFRVTSGALLRPSVIVKLTYFVVNHDEYVSDAFEWEEEFSEEEDATKGKHPDVDSLGSKEQLESLQHGLQRLDHYLLNVTNEQRYLYARTVRHLHTAKSTLARTFWYYTAIYGAICAASFSQLVGVRVMFQRSRKQGLII